MTNPWDAVPDLVTSQQDICACQHSRAVHTSTEERHRCWSCRLLGPQAPARPDHRFHLVFPQRPPTVLPRGVGTYQPPADWDAPEPELALTR